MILPVAYALEDRGIVARVRTGSQLDSATVDAVVAFEADDVDPAAVEGGASRSPASSATSTDHRTAGEPAPSGG